MTHKHSPKQQGVVDRVACVASSALASEPILAETVSILASEHPLWNWVGIYLLSGDELVLGPYVGPPTQHERIPVGLGVCGQAVAESHDLAVDDVRDLDNYLACSASTRSELVVLITDASSGDIVGQFDIDSDTVAAFSDEDRALLSHLAEIVAPHCATLVSQNL